MNRKEHNIIIAIVIIAAIATLIYFKGGRGSIDQNINKLEKNSAVQSVSHPDAKTLRITCKDGKVYNIIYQEGQTDYDNLVFDRCGQGGGAVQK